MKNQFMCYSKSQNGIINIYCYNANDLLLNYLNQRHINYYCRNSDTVEMYFRLHNTGIKIKQRISIALLGYRCFTHIMEEPRNTAGEKANLLSRISSINAALPQGSFVFDFSKNQLSFVDSFALPIKRGIINTQNIFERFERLVFLPHYLLEVDHPDFALWLFKTNI